MKTTVLSLKYWAEARQVIFQFMLPVIIGPIWVDMIVPFRFFPDLNLYMFSSVFADVI